MKKITFLLIISILSCYASAQSGLDTEGFEGDFPPSGWGIYQNEVGTSIQWKKSTLGSPAQPPFEGSYAAFMDRQNVVTGTPQDWLATPKIILPLQAQVRFYSRLTISQMQGNIYELRISTSENQGDLDSYHLLKSWTEDQLNPTFNQYLEKLVDIPADIYPEGQEVWLALVMYTPLNGDRWLVDNFRVVQKCLTPTNLTSENITQTSADLSWDNPEITEWEIEIVTNTESFSGSGEVYSDVLPYSINTLVNSTTYKYRVRALCENGLASEWSEEHVFSTLFLPPVNDDCNGAITIPVNPVQYCVEDTQGTLRAATASPELASCVAIPDDDVWFDFIATNTTHLISLYDMAGSTGDLVHMLYGGDGCGLLSQLSCSDPESSEVTGLTIGEIYRIRVFSKSETAQIVTFSICVTTPPPPPSNDECGAASNIPVNLTPACDIKVPGMIYSATASPPANSCGIGEADDDIWFEFVAANVQHYITISDVTGNTDLVHTVYSGSCDATLSQIYCSDPDNSFYTNFITGDTYRIRVFSKSASAQTSTFDICVSTPPPPPPNDSCAGAAVVAVNPDTVCNLTLAGTVYSATASSEGLTSCGGSPDDDVWFEFTATYTEHTIRLQNVSGSVTNLTHILYQGDDCTAMTQIYCSDPDISTATGLTIGQTYKIRVFTFTGTPFQNTSFDICITTPLPPANDSCATPTTIPVNNLGLTCFQKVSGTVNGSTNSPETINLPCSGNANDDVWFEFVATHTKHFITIDNITGSTTNLTHVVYQGTDCGALIQLYCSDPNNSVASGLAVGQTYRVRVYTFTAAPNQTSSFDICITTPPPPPVNDQCAAAVTVPVNTSLACDLYVSGSVLSATESPENNLCSGGDDDDVWFRFTASGKKHIITFSNFAGSTIDLGYAVYKGDNCGLMEPLYCGQPGINSSVTPDLIIGEVYKIRVYSFTDTAEQTSTFELCITTPISPVNDSCANAIVVPVNPDEECGITVAGTVFAATASPEANACGGNDDDDTWFEFTATYPRQIIDLIIPIGSAPLYHSLYAGGSCGSLSLIYCSEAANSYAQDLIVGEIYKIRVYTPGNVAPPSSTFSICIGTPPSPPSNDSCATPVIAVVNNALECLVTTPGSIHGATASPEDSNCPEGDDDDVWFEFTATAPIHHIAVQDILGSEIDLSISLYGGDECAELTQIDCGDTFLHDVDNLTIGETYMIRVYTTDAVPGQTSTFNLCIISDHAPITTDNTTYTVPELVEDILMGIPCVEVSNITWSTGSNFGAANGIAYFEKSSSNFGIEKGVVLSTKDAMDAPGPHLASSSDGQWPGDATLLNYLQDTGIDPGLMSNNNATMLEFDFVPLTNRIQFDFIFASDEYHYYTTAARQCSFSDAFAAFLTGPDVGGGGNVTKNLAVLPDTAIPVSVLTIREEVQYNNCEPQNEEYFDRYNEAVFQSSTEEGGSVAGIAVGSINFGGYTVPMSAASDVIPSQTYHIKLVIADSNDFVRNSAVFLSGLKIGQPELGADLLVSTGTAICPGATNLIESGVNPASATIKWYRNDILQAETGPNFVASEPGLYEIEVIYSAACTLTDSVAIEFYPSLADVINEAEDMTLCGSATGFATFNLSLATATILEGEDAASYTVTYHSTQDDANAGEDSLPLSYENTQAFSQTLYVRIFNHVNACPALINSFELIVQPAVSPVTSFSYTTPVCIDSPDNPLPFSTTGFTPGGSYSLTSGSGLVIDALTGEIDLEGSNPGTYQVTYEIVGMGCVASGSSSFWITINPSTNPDVAFSYGQFCINVGENPLPIPASGDFVTGGQFSTDDTDLDVDLFTGEINLATSQPGTYTVNYAVGADAALCRSAGASQAEITIFPEVFPNTAFMYEASVYCSGGGDIMPIGDFDPDGTFSAEPSTGLVLDPTTGRISLSDSSPGSYEVTYLIPVNDSSCRGETSSVFAITIGEAITTNVTGGCSGNQYLFTASPADVSYDYIWKDADGNTVSGNDSVFNATAYVTSLSDAPEYPILFTLTIAGDSCEDVHNFEWEGSLCGIPRGISPNNDGDNDSFNLTGLNVRHISIFNRYGTVVFTRANYVNEWNGQTNSGDELPDGTYFYLIERTGAEAQSGWVYLNR